MDSFKRQRSGSMDSCLLHQESEERDVQGICGPEVNLRLDGMLSPTEPVMSDEEKLKRRREGNRLAAARLRAKRTERVQRLEEEKKAVEIERDAYKQNMLELDIKCRSVMAENEYLRAQLAALAPVESMLSEGTLQLTQLAQQAQQQQQQQAQHAQHTKQAQLVQQAHHVQQSHAAQHVQQGQHMQQGQMVQQSLLVQQGQQAQQGQHTQMVQQAEEPQISRPVPCLPTNAQVESLRKEMMSSIADERAVPGQRAPY